MVRGLDLSEGKQVRSRTSDLYSTSTLEYSRVTIHCHKHLRSEISCARVLIHTELIFTFCYYSYKLPLVL